jgi:DNA-binding transcriptional LysR family regulator
MKGIAMIELRQFRQFLAVAELGSFRRAAERLNMAQPPLTVAIRKIEEEIGAPLLERTNRIVRLTDAGAVFLEEARRVVRQAEWATQAARRAAAGLTGRLRIGFVPHAAREVLPLILRKFRESNPEVELELKEGLTGSQIVALLNGEADVGFVIPPIKDSSDLQMRVLWRQSLVAVLPSDHRLADARTVSLADLADEPWVLFPARGGQGLHERVRTACLSVGFVPRVAQEALLMDTMVGLVSSGIGVGLVSRNLSNESRGGVVFRDLKGPGCPIDYEICVVHAQPTPVVAAFMECVRNWTGPGRSPA